MMNARVLVVDDEPMITHNLQAFLEDEGMQVESVNSVEEALQRLHQGKHFDICIMDIRLPGLDGNAGVRALYSVNPALRFIIHTGSEHYSLPADLQAMGIGKRQLFFKPVIDMGHLARTIRTLIAP
jgi:DNA-binding NtrC family response regulator